MIITRLTIFFGFILSVMMCMAEKYQIKVLNTPTITIDNREAKVGDWFNDQSVITWSRDNQAMRVVSEANKVYTLSAKLYKESKAKKFSDFVTYTKPLAARGTKDLDIIEQLAERFDNTFVMLDEIVIDLSGIKLSEKCKFQLVKENKQDNLIVDLMPQDRMITIYRTLIETFNPNNIVCYKVLYYNGRGDVQVLPGLLEVIEVPMKINFPDL